MDTDLVNLTADQKVQKVLELVQEGYSRRDISTMLYNTAKPNDGLNSLRKLMISRGFAWDKEANTYVDTNKQKQTATNEIPVPEVSPEARSDEQKAPVLTGEEILALKELVAFKSELEGFREALQSPTQAGIGNVVESPLEFTKFRGLLQGTTLQLHSEVWEALDGFCKKYKVSKKAVVNEAIWDFLKKWGDGSDAEN